MKKELLKIILIFIAVLSLNAQNDNVTDNWGQIFEKHHINGTFVLYNPASGNYNIYNVERSDSAFLPASTFKILNSLIALETSAIHSIDDTIKWDGIDRGWDKWNMDQTMKTAMPLSCVWFYQELARRIGEKDMQKWIDTVGYGNTKMGGKIDNFWLGGDLRISAIEQVKFIERLINNDLPFDTLIQETVKSILITDSADHYILHSKTGWAARVAHEIGWFVGYVETNNETWIFALNMDINTEPDTKYRKQITYEILQKEGIIE